STLLWWDSALPGEALCSPPPSLSGLAGKISPRNFLNAASQGDREQRPPTIYDIGNRAGIVPRLFRIRFSLPMANFVVFTDLDGCLLDSVPYTYEPAVPALEALRAQGIPLVLVSSKTRAEIEPLRKQLDHHDPFIVENGAAVFVPRGLFDFPLE